MKFVHDLQPGDMITHYVINNDIKFFTVPVLIVGRWDWAISGHLYEIWVLQGTKVALRTFDVGTRFEVAS